MGDDHVTRKGIHVTATEAQHTWSTKMQLDDVLASFLANSKNVGKFSVNEIMSTNTSNTTLELHFLTFWCSRPQEHPANFVLREKNLCIATNHIGSLEYINHPSCYH